MKRVKDSIIVASGILSGIWVMSNFLYFILMELSLKYDYIDSVFSKIYLYICLITVVFIAYSLTRIIVIFRESIRNDYLEKVTCHNLSNALVFTLRNYVFWIGFGTIAVVYLLLPLNVTFMALYDMFSVGEVFIKKLIVVSVFLPIMLLIMLLGWNSACRYWSFNRDNEKYTKRAYRKSLTIIFGIYLVCPIAILTFLPLLWSISPVILQLVSPELLIVVAVLILGVILVNIIRALYKRRSFLKNLEDVCKKKGYNISAVSIPYRSVFSPGLGESFSVMVGDKKYSCKLVGGYRKYIPLVVHSNGELQFVHTFRLFRFTVYKRSVLHRYHWDSDNVKILIINPIPKHVYKINSGKTVEIDNGEIIGDCRVYSATGFLRSLELDVVDRS